MRTIEACLRAIIDKAALLRYLGNAGMSSSDAPDSSVLSALGDIAGEIEELLRRVRDALPVDALNESIDRRR